MSSLYFMWKVFSVCYFELFVIIQFCEFDLLRSTKQCIIEKLTVGLVHVELILLLWWYQSNRFQRVGPESNGIHVITVELCQNMHPLGMPQNMVNHSISSTSNILTTWWILCQNVLLLMIQTGPIWSATTKVGMVITYWRFHLLAAIYIGILIPL